MNRSINRSLNKSAVDEGKLTSNELRNGPLAERGCTDIFCCLIFIAFVILSSALAIYAFKNGNPSKLKIPYDSS